MAIKIDFINQSDDINNTQIIIFQKEAGESPVQQALAWKITINTSKGDNHPFEFTPQVSSPAGATVHKAGAESAPVICLQVVPKVADAQIKAPAIVSNVNTELSLLGIASADIVMTGGGGGNSTAPFTFTLQNVVMA